MPARLTPSIISLIVVVLIAGGAGALYLVNQSSDAQSSTSSVETTSSTTPDEATTESTPETTAIETSVSVYTDGTYSAEGSYSTPGGSETISLTLTLDDDVITDVTASGSASGGNSKQYQQQFLAGYKSLVVGKAIDEVALSRVAGSSLTSTGFTRALETIKNDARS